MWFTSATPIGAEKAISSAYFQAEIGLSVGGLGAAGRQAEVAGVG
jgi:hypothetical protein